MDKLSKMNMRRLAALLSFELTSATVDPLLFSGANDSDWEAIHELSAIQATDALAFSGVMSLPEALRPREELVNEWKGAKTRYFLTGQWQIRMQSRCMDELNNAGIPSAAVFGADICGLYPRLQLRPLAGIRLLVPEGRAFEAASVLAPDAYVVDDMAEISVSGAKIYILGRCYPKGFGVASDALKQYMAKRHKRTENVELFGREFPVMDADRRCAALLSHIGERLFDGGADMRSLCDWAMFVRSVPDPEQWQEWFGTVLKDSGLISLAVYLTACAEKYLLFTDCPWSVTVSDGAVDSLFEELMTSGADGRAEKNLSARASVEELLSGVASRRSSDRRDDLTKLFHGDIASELRLFDV